MKLHDGIVQTRAFKEIVNLITICGTSKKKAANLIIDLMSDSDEQAKTNRAAYAALKK